MSSLLAILLVIKSDAGDRFVFKYPMNPKRREKVKPRSNTAEDGAELQQTNSTRGVYGVYGYSAPESWDVPHQRLYAQQRKEGSPGGGAGGPNSSTTGITSRPGSNTSTTQPQGDTLLGFDTNLLANVLSAPNSMCDRKFQLTIDDLTFVGHPTSLMGEEFDRRKSLVMLPRNEEDDYENEDTGYTGRNAAGGRDQPQPGRQRTDSSGKRDDHFRPSANLNASNHSRGGSPSPSRQPGKPANSPHSSYMTQFHLVFVLAPSDLELSREVEAIYKHVVIKLTAALRFEQLRCEYVRKEAEMIMQLTDEAAKKKEDANKKKEETNRNVIPTEAHESTMEQILNASSLARDIKHVFDSICNNTIAHIILNDFIDLSLQIPTLGSGNSMLYAALEGDYYSMIPDLVGTSGSGNGYGYECDTYPILCPYHALLLLNDPEEVLQNVPMDSSPTLIHLVQMLTPTLNLHELSMLLDCSLAQVYRLSAHLIYWRKAKLIHTIAVRNIYIVSPQANLSDLSALTKDFNKHIPTLDLPFLLASLSTPRPFSHIIPSKDQRTLYLEAITYLLRKDLVIQLHQYFVLMVPRHVQVVYARPRENEGETGEEADAVGSSGDQGQPELPSTLFELDEATTVVSGPGQATEVERGWVLRLAEEKGGPKEVIELFQSLVHYFNGKHHIEEILWRNRITRKQLRMVTEWFRDELVSVYHY